MSILFTERHDIICKWQREDETVTDKVNLSG